MRCAETRGTVTTAPARAEVPDVRIAHVRPDTHVRLREADERPDLPRVIHTQFNDANLGPGGQEVRPWVCCPMLTPCMS